MFTFQVFRVGSSSVLVFHGPNATGGLISVLNYQVVTASACVVCAGQNI